MSVTREAVLEYLKSHPEIFEEQDEFFHQVEISHPYSGRTISLAERQMINLREKNRLLEHRLGELLGVGETNDALGARMHQLTIALVGANRLDQMVSLVLKSLAEDFGVPQARMRLWGEGAANLSHEVCTPVSAELVKEISGMNHPFTGSVRTGEVIAWFGGDDEGIASMALVPLRFEGQVLGLLAMGSDDAERFVAGMGTLYIERLGDVIAAALARVLRRG
jgi:uncharacterized protein YigA (DUF484 family)